MTDIIQYHDKYSVIMTKHMTFCQFFRYTCGLLLNQKNWVKAKKPLPNFF